MVQDVDGQLLAVQVQLNHLNISHITLNNINNVRPAAVCIARCCLPALSCAQGC